MLNKQGRGKIDWTDYTWNPITGCLKGCDYCYVKRLNERFNYSMAPQFHSRRLNDVASLRAPARIFVCSTGDMWGDWVERNWIEQVLDVVKKYPQHTFQFLTKNPERYLDFDFTPNCWLGTTMDGTCNTSGNVETLGLKKCDNIKFCSLEPLLHPVDFYNLEPLHNVCPADLSDMDWIIIGADTNKGAKKPPDRWADNIISDAKECHIPVWVKDNYKYRRTIKQLPKEVR